MHVSPPSVYDLNHEQSGSINTLVWNGEGELLGTGSFDGQICIWSKNGELEKTLNHGDCILSIEWNRQGDFLLTGSSDNRVIVWDTNTWESKQEFQFLSENVLGVVWRYNASFAVFSKEMRIYVCNVGESKPIQGFFGHQKEISGIKWDPTGTLLASYSCDGVIKIWTIEQRQSLHSLIHSQIVCSVRWSPTGPGTRNRDKRLLLASASIDKTVRIWDCNQWYLLYSFSGHRGPVTGIEFSPDGEYLVSGSEDQQLLIWKVKDGTIVKSYRGYESTIYNASWNREGNKVVGGFRDGTLRVLGLSLDHSSVH